MLTGVVVAMGAVAIVVTALSLTRFKAWWVRACDFPRVQVLLLAAAALALQSMRHSLEFSYGASRHRIIAAVRQPPLEQPFDAATQQRMQAQAAGPAEPSAAPPRPSLVRRVFAAWHVFDGLPGVTWAKKMVAFPIGERFAAIALTSAFFTPRTTFTVLLVWGGFAGLYTLAGRFLRSLVG